MNDQSDKSRLLSVDELSDRMMGWLEERKQSEVLPVIGGRTVYDGAVRCFIDALDRSVNFRCDEYNVTWRIWTSEPSEKERADVRWDNQE